MKAYKGFEHDLMNMGHQYEVGKTYECEDAVVGERGFHACLRPLDVFAHYAPGLSRYCEVEVDEDGLSRSEDDREVAACRITIIREISLRELHKAQLEYEREHGDEHTPWLEWCAVSCGNGSAASGGDRSSVVGGKRSAVAGGNWSSVIGDKLSAVAGAKKSSVEGGDQSSVAGGDRSFVTGGERSFAAGGKASRVTVNKLSAAAGGDGSTVTGSYRSAVSGSDWSNVTGGDRAVVAGGRQSLVRGHRRSTLAGGEESTVIGGDQSAAVSRMAVSVGANGAALCRGRGCEIRGGLGSVLVIVEENRKDHDIAAWKAVVVDGETIKADTWYKLENGKLIEAE